MNHRIDNLLEQAKKLSADERAALIDALYDLNAPPDPEWEAAWIGECEDRLAALGRGGCRPMMVTKSWPRRAHD